MKNLRTMRSIQQTTRNTVNQSLANVESLRADLHSQYLRAKEDMESFQAQIHSLHASKLLFIEQRLALDAGIKDLDAMLHPIRRFPFDILSIIFQLVITSIPDSHETLSRFQEHVGVSRKTRAAITLASVCQKWRHVTEDTPSLWKDIIVAIPDNPTAGSSLVKFLSKSLLRIKKLPPDITILLNDFSHEPELSLQWFPFLNLPKINVLRIMSRGASSITTSQVISLLPRLKAKILHLKLDCPVGRIHSPVWNFLNSGTKATVKILSVFLDVHGITTLPPLWTSVQELYLEHGGIIRQSLVAQFSQLRVLRIKNSGGMVGTASNITFHELRELDVYFDTSIIDTFIAGRWKCPKLERLEISKVDLSRNPSILSFFSTLTSLQHLGANLHVKEINEHFPNLKSLKCFLYDQLVPLYKRQPGEAPLLPQLQRLQFMSEDHYVMNVKTFDALVEARCVPAMSSGVTFNESFRAIEVLELFPIRHNNEAAWNHSKHLKHATVTKDHVKGTNIVEWRH